MKFVCDSCNTKYSIADERVHGRVLKIRCKTCDHVITVREEMKATPAASSIAEALGRNLAESESEHTVVSMPPPSSPQGEADEWYISFDGEQEGPIPLARALDRVRIERPKGKEAHCWRPGFFVWLPIEEVPEFAPALERKRKPTPPPPVPAAARTVKSPTGSQPAVTSSTGPHPKSPTGSQPVAKSPTGSQPVVKSPTGSQPVVKSPTGSQPAVKSNTGPHPKSPTGSQPIQKPAPAVMPALSNAAPAGGALASELLASEPLPPMDSKPMALPPPPEPLKDAPLNLPLPAIPAPLPMGDSIPSGPMAVQVTKPEPRIARRALEEEQPDEKKPEEKPAETHSEKKRVDKKDEKKEDKKPEPLIPLREPGAPEVSPFAAALAAATGGEPKGHDTGPVPLPPPPGESDLAIGEPSGLLSISHLAQTPSLSREKPVIDTFGGVAVTPAGQNGTSSAAPVVVVAGPAQSAAAWVKYSVAALLLLVVALGGTVVYLVTKKPLPPPPGKTTDTVEANRHVDDKPIQFADPAPPTSIGPATPDPKKTAPQSPKHSSPASKGTAAAGPKLSDEQKKLAALYGDSGEKGTPKDTSVVDRSERSSGGQVSQASILAVVTQNRRALNLCYDRVLKHDSSLKRARLVTHVKVGLSGAVTAVSVPDPEYANSEIGQCLTQTIKRWHFPAADAEYETEFPIILQAE